MISWKIIDSGFNDQSGHVRASVRTGQNKSPVNTRIRPSSHLIANVTRASSPRILSSFHFFKVPGLKYRRAGTGTGTLLLVKKTVKTLQTHLFRSSLPANLIELKISLRFIYRKNLILYPKIVVRIMAASDGSEYFALDMEAQVDNFPRQSNAESVAQDEEELMWAALERLPTRKRQNFALLKRAPSRITADDDAAGGSGEKTEAVDVRKLNRVTRELVVKQALATSEQDNYKLLAAIKERLDR